MESWSNKLFKEFTTDVAGKIQKQVTCENCRERYVYLLERKATGSGISLKVLDDDQVGQDRAYANAQQKLQDCLDNDYELIPCPACGAYQSRMVASLRRSHQMWMWALAMLLVIAVVPMGLLTLFYSRTAGLTPLGYCLIALNFVMFIAPFVLFRLHKYLGSKFDPNAGDPEPRKQIARERALLVKDLQRENNDLR